MNDPEWNQDDPVFHESLNLPGSYLFLPGNNVSDFRAGLDLEGQGLAPAERILHFLTDLARKPGRDFRFDILFKLLGLFNADGFRCFHSSFRLYCL